MPAEAITEKQIQNEIIRFLGTNPAVRVWRSNTGVARFGKQVVRFGIKGQADITGIFSVEGLACPLWIEVKSSNGVQTKEQKDFQNMIEKFNGLYILARSVQDVENAISIYRNRIISILGKSSKN